MASSMLYKKSCHALEVQLSSCRIILAYNYNCVSIKRRLQSCVCLSISWFSSLCRKLKLVKYPFKMRILVAGAGIAGNTLAFWLSKLGHDITVIERHASLRTNGLQIDVRGDAISVLKWMGLDEAFKSNAIPESGI